MRASPLSTDLVHLICIRGEYLNSCFPVHSIPNQSELYNSAYPHSGISQGQTQDNAAILILSSAVRGPKPLSLSCIFLINVPDSCHDHQRWPSWCFRTALIRLWQSQRFQTSRTEPRWPGFLAASCSWTSLFSGFLATTKAIIFLNICLCSIRLSGV